VSAAGARGREESEAARQRGADMRARAHNAGRLRWLTGGTRRTGPGGAFQTRIEIKIRIQTLQTNFQTVSNFD
jgi:hypothetical protein